MQGKCNFDPEKHLLIGLFDDYCVLYDKQNDKVIDSKKIGANSENNKSANPTGYKKANEQSMSSNKRGSRTKSSTTQPKYASHVIENDTDLNSSLMRYNDDQAAAATSDVDLNYDAMVAPIHDALDSAKFGFYNGDPRITPKTIDGVSQLLREKFKEEDENNTATKKTSQKKAVIENESTAPTSIDTTTTANTTTSTTAQKFPKYASDVIGSVSETSKLPERKRARFIECEDDKNCPENHPICRENICVSERNIPNTSRRSWAERKK